MEIFDDFGNSDLLYRKKTAFLCSRQVPLEHHGRILDWAYSVSPARCIICGRQTSLERQVCDILLQRGIPLIWVALGNEEVKSEIDQLRSYVMQDRMLILSLFPPENELSRRQKQFMRNLSVLEHADQIVVGYCTADGTLDRQLAGQPQIEYLVPQHEAQRYLDFMKFQSGSVSIEDFDNQLRIIQKRESAPNTILKEMLTLAPDEVIRLRNALNRAIEAHHWEESPYAEIRETYPNAFKPWSADEELILRQLSLEGRSDADIAQLLGRQPSAVASRLQKLIEQESSNTHTP